MANISIQVNADNDDACKSYDVTPQFFNGVNLLVGYNHSTSFDWSSGMIFRGLNIPQGSTVQAATLVGTASVSRFHVVVNSRIRAYNADDYSDNLSSEAKWDAIFPSGVTTATVEWDAIVTMTLDTEYTSPDISPVIQEVVDRPGWVSGNDIVIFWDDHDGRGDQEVAHLRDIYAHEGDPTKAAKLNITFIPKRARIMGGGSAQAKGKSPQGRIVNVSRYTANQTLVAANHNVACDTDGGAFTITLPAGRAGTEYRIGNTGTSGNDLTITPDGAELLIGANDSFDLTDSEVLHVVYEPTEGWM